MTSAPLQITLIGFNDQQQHMLLNELRSTGVPTIFNLAKGNAVVKAGPNANDIVFLHRKSTAPLDSLFRYFHKQNPDCIVVEVLPVDHDYVVNAAQPIIQSCQIIYSPERLEFRLAIQFVLQYGLLKKDFRSCKSLLNLSERRVLKLVDSSTQAIAYLSQGKFIHANIAFMALFSAESMGELARFSLLKLIDSNEKYLLADYLVMACKGVANSVDLTLSMRKISGLPFVAKVSAASVVYQGRRCIQLWVSPAKLVSKAPVIPVTKALNVWELPLKEQEAEDLNPFDQTVDSGKSNITEESISVLLKGLEQGGGVQLNLKEIYDLKRGALNSVWAILDVNPTEFRQVNLLLAKMQMNKSSGQRTNNFWEQLLFRLVFDALYHESQSRRSYYIALSLSAVRDDDLMSQLTVLLSALGNKTRQLKIVFDASVSMDDVPKILTIAKSLRALNCEIVIENFSLDPAPLYLYKNLHPSCVFFDKYWLESLKEKPDGCLFLSRFVQQLESKSVSVMLPQIVQKRKDRLLVLSGASFGQEKTTKNCA